MEVWKNVKKQLMEAPQSTLILDALFGLLADGTEKGSRKYVFWEADFFMILGRDFHQFWVNVGGPGQK